MFERRPAPQPRGSYVPLRCQRTPNATFDRAFAIFVCNQRDPRCPFYGPVFIQDSEGGRTFECRKCGG
jgi:hypothetical protein